MRADRWLRQAATVVGLAVVYGLAARLGLMLDAVAGFATLVWPPTGIALAALLLLGYRVWPGVVLGAFAANVWNGATPLVALGIAAGNTLEAVVGVYALRRIPGFRSSLDRLRAVIPLIVFAAGLSTMVSATIGVSSLYLGGIVSAADAGKAWRAWWLGDLIADLVVAPAILVWAAARRIHARLPRMVEGVALVASVVAVNLFIFGGSVSSETAAFRSPYVIFPTLMWAALRFGQRGAVSMTFLTATIAVIGTVQGLGPFVRPLLHESLFALQAFMGIAAATFLVLGASIEERRAAVTSLSQAHETVAEANRSKSDFLAVMSHELRTPLNAISGYVELLTLQTDDRLNDVERGYLARIRTNQQQLLAMIEDVLSFTGIEAGRLTVTRRTVVVGEILSGLRALIEPELARKQITFVCEPCDASVAVSADADRLRQILVNLIGNAVKFTPRDGRVDVRAFRYGDAVRISVRDTGVGIPRELLERVFEPFFQVERGSTRGYPGVGLGLAIARDFVRAMGGDLWLDSEPGRGTTASLELPAADVSA